MFISEVTLSGEIKWLSLYGVRGSTMKLDQSKEDGLIRFE